MVRHPPAGVLWQDGGEGHHAPGAEAVVLQGESGRAKVIEYARAWGDAEILSGLGIGFVVGWVSSRHGGVRWVGWGGMLWGGMLWTGCKGISCSESEHNMKAAMSLKAITHKT